jgi:GTPase SAR1 family protein
MSSPNEDRSELSAKVVVLGDAGTGKTSMIKSIMRAGTADKPKSSLGKQESIFSHTTVIAGGSKNKTRVRLKIWEYSTKQSREESEIILRNALFCIIMFDLRSPESANSAFNNWLMLREKFMPESFLMVVGTHLDLITSRRVEAAELTKACAQNDAMYMEVSNSDNTNLAVVWRVMSQRLGMMVDVREKIHSDAKEGMNPAQDSDEDDIDPYVEHERKVKNRRDKFASMLESEVLDTRYVFCSFLVLFFSLFVISVCLFIIFFCTFAFSDTT